MKFTYLLVIALFCTLGAKAQAQPVKNSVRIGIDATPIDGLQPPALRYQVRYAKHLFSDRLLIGASIGYLRGHAKEEVREGFYIDGNFRRRVTGEVDVLFDLLPSTKYALRLGGGPSLIHRQDNLLKSWGYSNNQNGSVTYSKVERQDLTGFQVGYHLLLEYEQAIGTNLSLSGRIGMTDAKSDSPRAQAGLGVSYSFR